MKNLDVEQIKAVTTVDKIVEVFMKNPKFEAVRDNWGVEVDPRTGLFTTWVDPTLSPTEVQRPPRVCGLGALLIGKEALWDDGSWADEPELACQNLLGMSEGYVEGFTTGFDGGDSEFDPEHVKATEDYTLGRRDGEEAYNRLFALGRTYQG